MKKLLTLLLSFGLVTAFAQTPSKFNIAVSGGLTIPVGDFGDDDLNNDAAGFALTGFYGELSLNAKIVKNIGFTAMVRMSNAKFNDAAYASYLLEQSGYTWNLTSEPWKMTYIMGGLKESYNLSNNTNLHFRVLAGLLSAKSANIYAEVSSGGQSFWVEQGSSKASSFAYLLGLGFETGLAKQLNLTLNVDYLNGKPDFETTTRASNGASSINTFKQPVTTIGAGIGVAYKF